MAETHWITKGTRLRAEWFDTKPVALAGAQMKLGATSRSVIGTVTGVYGDAPKVEDCEKTWYEVQPDDGGDVVRVDPKWVKEVLS